MTPEDCKPQCMHDWSWSVDLGRLIFLCKNEGCEYNSEQLSNGIGLIGLREAIWRDSQKDSKRQRLADLDELDFCVSRERRLIKSDVYKWIAQKRKEIEG